jgi:flagella basal body P-ring formation protein FlgA
MSGVHHGLGILTITLLMASDRGLASEIQLRELATCSSAIVRLSDVAEIHGVDALLARPWEQVALAPAPVGSGTRVLAASEIRGILMRRGIDLAGVRFTGATRVHVVNGEPKRADSTERSVPASARHDLASVKQQLTAAIREHLPSGHVPAGWQVEVELSRRQLWDLPEAWNEIRVTGLTSPIERQQDVTVEFVSRQGVARIPVRVELQPRPLAVVATRALDRGVVLRNHDVELCAIDMAAGERRTATKLDEVIGKELQQRVLQGQLIRTDAVRQPLLVRRRELVDVVARNGSITVSRKARAREDGALGDLVQLETLDQKSKTLQARVIAARQVELQLGAPAAR